MMNVMLYIHDQNTLADLSQFLSLDTRINQVLLCKDPALVWKQFLKYQPDAVFISLGNTRSSSIDGLQLAKKIRRKSVRTVIVFLSAERSHALDAYQAYPLDFILLPIHKPRLSLTLDRLLIDRVYIPESGKSTPVPALTPLQSSQMSIQCFGQYVITSGIRQQDPIRLPSKKCRELLAFLLAHTNKTVTREIILENLFDGRQDKNVVNQLHVSIYQLRKALHCYRNGISITGQYRIEVGEGVCDLVDFARLTRRHVPIAVSNIQEIERIAARYIGPCFEFEDYPWAGELRAELEYAHEQLLIRIATFHEAQNQTANSEQVLKTLIHLNPYSEDGNHALLDLYLRKKDQRKFVRQFEAYQVILMKELNVSMDQRYQRAYRTFRPS